VDSASGPSSGPGFPSFDGIWAQGRGPGSRLFTGLSRQPPAPSAQLHWSRWRRRHQATARACHYRRRALAPHDYEVSLEYQAWTLLSGHGHGDHYLLSLSLE
jgi:hypothetical protein